jgi:catechol 2,3-dioxygenase-like lactoylglutathione lyase family enzyme
MKFSGVMIGSDNPDRLGAFYTKVLGEPGWHDGTWYGWADGANLMLGAYSGVHGSNASPQRIILTLDAENVEKSFKEITALGAGIVAELYRPEGAPGKSMARHGDRPRR